MEIGNFKYNFWSKISNNWCSDFFSTVLNKNHLKIIELKYIFYFNHQILEVNAMISKNLVSKKLCTQKLVDFLVGQ